MRALLVVCALASASVAHAQDEACEGVDCSGEGECFEENGAAHCLCDAGFAELGLACVPGDGEEATRRARHAPDAAARIVAEARREVGRKRWDVGEDREAFPGPLTDYLEPLEWWCGDFVSWIYAAAGVPLTGGSAGGWLITDNRAIAAWFAQRGDFVDRRHPEWETYAPRPGDYVRFRTARYGHAAIVERVRGETIFTIEGNVSNAVLRGTYARWRRDRQIEGIGRMALDNGVPSVDAGPDLEVWLGETVTLAGAADDDGPLDALYTTWSVPAAVHVGSPGTPETTVRVDAPGTYELALFAEDGEHTGVDRVLITARRLPEPAPEPEAVLAAPPTRAGCRAAPGAPSPGWLTLALLAFVRRRG